MQQRQAYILVGPSGSGKSAFTALIRKLHEKIDTFSLDIVRCSLFIKQPGVAIPKSVAGLYHAAFMWCSQNREAFDDEVTKTWNDLLITTENIICDNTHLNEGNRKKWVDDLRNRGFFINMIYIKVPEEVAIERQKTRSSKSVPVDSVKAQYAKLEEPLEHEYDKLVVIDGTKIYTQEEWHTLLQN